MSIYSRRYQRYDGPIEGPRSRFLAIAEVELRRLAKEKWARRLMLMAWLPVGYFAIMLYIINVVKAATNVELGGRSLFQALFSTELVFVSVMLAAFGASMISRDIESKALTLYFTRPVDAAQYHWGKLVATASLVLVVTLAPGLLLAVAQGAVEESFSIVTFVDTLWRIVLCSGAMAFAASNLILLLSSTGWSSRYVGATWLGLFTLLEVARNALYHVFGGSPLLDLISIGRLFTGAVSFLFGGHQEDLPALIALIVFGGAFFILLRIRLIALEKVRS